MMSVQCEFNLDIFPLKHILSVCLLDCLLMESAGQEEQWSGSQRDSEKGNWVSGKWFQPLITSGADTMTHCLWVHYCLITLL